MSNNMLRLICGSLLFALTFTVLKLVPSVAALQFAIHGAAGWVTFVAGAIGAMVVMSYLSGFFGAMFGPSVKSNIAVRIGVRIFAYLCFAGLIVAGAKYLPDLFSVTEPVGLYWMFGSIGVVLSIYDYVIAPRFPRDGA